MRPTPLHNNNELENVPWLQEPSSFSPAPKISSVLVQLGTLDKMTLTDKAMIVATNPIRKDGRNVSEPLRKITLITIGLLTVSLA
jgi:hypothetical protein